MTRFFALGAVGLAASTAFAGLTVQAGSASAVEAGLGYVGVCRGADARTGTTVVVDFQQLDGNGGSPAPTIVRCSPNPSGTPRTGLAAMQGAGIQPTGVPRYGLAFVCRIDGRPSATETLPITGNPGYKEACLNTPPAAASWSYWWGDGTTSSWSYGTSGASNRYAIAGGFEGWSFALNATATSNPVPRVSPLNPALGSSQPTVALTSDDSDGVLELGQSTTLRWSSSNTTRRTAAATPKQGAGPWSGMKPVAGSQSVKPTKKGSFTYTLTGRKGAVSVTSSVTLTVR